MKAVATCGFAAALMFGASHLSASNQQLTGVVSDSMCGASHMAKDKTAAECNTARSTSTFHMPSVLRDVSTRDVSKG